jgi:hypothetical protein
MWTRYGTHIVRTHIPYAHPICAARRQMLLWGREQKRTQNGTHTHTLTRFSWDILTLSCVFVKSVRQVSCALVINPI